jgi:hypothetical protein
MSLNPAIEIGLFTGAGSEATTFIPDSWYLGGLGAPNWRSSPMSS